MISRSHPEKELEGFHKNEGVQSFVTCGSALKFAQIALGNASIYARFVSLSIWDIAAGDVLVRAAGGAMTDHLGHQLIYYSTKLKATPFIARA